MAALVAWAQEPAPPPVAPSDYQAPVMSPDQLDQMLGPVALYPDPLLSELFPAATLPSQIVLADRYVSQGGDPSQVDAQPWDPCIRAIAHYPQLLKWMDDNLEWTTQVGQAFMNQQQDVMDSIQRLRGKAQVLGNLQSTPQQTVVRADGAIDIEPANPDEVYLPTYPPDTIYDEPGIYCTFGFGWPIGAWLVYDWDWRHHHIIHWGPDHPRPGDWWHRSPQQRVGELARGRAPVWQPTGHGLVGSHPADRGWAQPEAHRAPVPVARPPEIGRPENPAPRGFEGRPPVQPPPRVESRQPVESRPVAPRPPVVESHPTYSPPPRIESSPASEPRGSSGAGFFGGPQSSSEARQSSVRGSESRGAAASGGAGGGRRR